MTEINVYAEYDEAIVMIAKGIDCLTRAAVEGYPVEAKTLDYLAEAFARDVCRPGADLPANTCDVRADIDNCEWKAPDDKITPTPIEFALLDRVKLIAREVNTAMPEAVGKWAVSRIVNVNVCPEEDHIHRVHAVLATLDTRGPSAKLRQITFSLEDMHCPEHKEWGPS